MRSVSVLGPYLKSFTLKLLLRLQRLNCKPPTIIRAPFLACIRRLTKDSSKINGVVDWSKPLIDSPDAPSAPEPDSNPPANCAGVSATNVSILAETAGAINETSDSRIRCLLATGALDAGGMDEVVVFLARRLQQFGIRTAVLHTSDQGREDGRPTGRLGCFLVANGIQTVQLDAKSGAEWVNQWNPDVISAHDPAEWVLPHANRVGIPYVDTLHGLLPVLERDPQFEAKRAELISKIVCVSELQRNQYLEVNRQFPRERIVTIPNGVDDLRRSPGDRGKARRKWGLRDEYLFVCLARHCEQKNTFGLVTAFGEVAKAHPEAHLLIAGRPDDSAYFSQVLRLRNSLACRDRIHLRDHYTNPAEILAMADGFVLNSFFEGWSLASMEALHAGLPVVLSDVGGAREQVGEGNFRGFLVPNPIGSPLSVSREKMRDARFERQPNRDALIEAMKYLISNRAMYLARRAALIEESAKRFHPDLCLQAHAEVLLEVTEKKAPQPQIS
jgi:glycosyltransferase involved in cell wall biosynthesis